MHQANSAAWPGEGCCEAEDGSLVRDIIRSPSGPPQNPYLQPIPAPSDHHDQALLARIANGEEIAFAALFHAWRDKHGPVKVDLPGRLEHRKEVDSASAQLRSPINNNC